MPAPRAIQRSGGILTGRDGGPVAPLGLSLAVTTTRQFFAVNSNHFANSGVWVANSGGVKGVGTGYMTGIPGGYKNRITGGYSCPVGTVANLIQGIQIGGCNPCLAYVCSEP